MRARQDKHGRKGNIGMACLAIEEQAKPAINMISKTNYYVANKYKHMNQINNLNNSAQEKDKRYKKPAEEKQLQEKKTYYARGSKEHLIKPIKSCIKDTTLFVTNEVWPEMSEEQLKYK